MLLKSLQRCINSVFKFIQLPLSYPHYSCLRKQTKTVNVKFKAKNKGTI
ncbi:Mobile element protein [Candidatus Enterovibrio altilux]|uniref:Mobile element protein n=1 Tax=Candidatus Enterovibrio altilux TaxID=1927128 RepID=A0A291B8E7_9GAMM|nr:Mobile element protein [Candidatus Enterovibrio luxaltus]